MCKMFKPSQSQVSLLLALELRLQLPVRRILNRRLDPLSPIAPRIACARALLLEAPPEHDRRFLIAGRAVQHSPEMRSSQLKPSLFPQRVSKIEPIVRVALVAIQSFLEIIRRGGIVLARQRRAEIVVNLVQRNVIRHHLELIDGAIEVSLVIFADAAQK